MANSIINVVDANNPNNNRKSVDLLPGIFRTDKNTNFLAGTIDHLIQPAQIDRLSGWVGSQETPTYNVATDYYIPETIPFRKKYQLNPAVVVYDKKNQIREAYAFDDLVNQISSDGGYVNKLDRLFKPEFMSYDPRIDWDKFVNYSQYYWVPTGPDSISIVGQELKTVSTYTVTDDVTKNYFVMTPDGLSENPTIKLFRGLTYNFEIDSVHTFWFKTARTNGTADAFTTTITGNGVKKGTITLTIDEHTPSTLYYASEDNSFAGGQILIESILENTAIDVEKDVIGKKHYKSGTGIELTNGMKINFQGNVTPTSYANKDFIVEGVGTAIKLVDYSILTTPENYAESLDDNFDGSPFDEYPFDSFDNLPMLPEYVTINRSSKDLNPWSRYNRWFHQDVLIATAAATGQELLLPQENRARRPIIEFAADIQLFNFGSQAVVNVQHIDTVTTNAFTVANGQNGWYIDKVLVDAGDLVVFANDADPLVRNKIYKAEFLNNDGVFKINFAEYATVDDGYNVSVAKGTTQAGSNWWYKVTSGNGNWVYGQQKHTLNQAPLFDVFDANGNSYNDSTYYDADFAGTKIFGYSVGEGTPDPVLGFPLEYKNIADQAFYLFSNYFMTDTFNVVDQNVLTKVVGTKTGFLRLNSTTPKFFNVWVDSADFQIPVVQFQVLTTSTKSIEVTGISNPGYNNPTIEVFVNNKKYFKVTDYNLLVSRSRLFVSLNTALAENDRVRIEIYSNTAPTDTGYYDIPLNWTNNPLNGNIGQFTLSELSNHVETMANRNPNFVGSFLGSNNARDLPDFSSYGTRLISNKNPLAFAGYFVCKSDTDLIQSIRKVATQYNQYKLALLTAATKLANVYKSPADALDVVLHNVNLIKDVNSPYSVGDMLAYGPNVISRDYVVEDHRFTQYTLPNGQFNDTELSLRSVLVYHTSLDGTVTQLLKGSDYTFDPYLAVVDISIPLVRGEIITVKDYADTTRCFVPVTPTKLGLYPKFEPQMYLDDSYASGPQPVIQGHDGSITLAYGDIRDDILLEFEKRIYNNIKVSYDSNLLDLNSVLPGAFRINRFSSNEANSILEQEFLRWTGFYGFDYQTNDTVTENPFTYNYSSAVNTVTNRNLPGNWRGMYKYFFDTDRPHLAPWEMLGFSVMPSWWEEKYGPAPYTSGNDVLWADLELGNINGTINPLYARPGLSKMIPVDDSGNLLDPATAGVAQKLNPITTTNNWKFGDSGPVETAWKRNSNYPFAVQILAALTQPADYYSKLFDTSRMVMNVAGQYIYKDTGTFITPDNVSIYRDNGTMASGWSVFLVETGLQHTSEFITNLKQDLSTLNLQLLYKTGGFVTPDKLELIIDSVNPNTTNPGVALNPEDYTVFLNQGAPAQVASISGFIISVTETGWQVKGYDTTNPYFPIFAPISSTKDSALTVGGKSEPYVTWTAAVTPPPQPTQIGNGVNPPTGTFYKSGQVVYYNGKWYRVTVSHTSGTDFNTANFVQLPTLPVTGGVSVTRPTNFETTVTHIPYGTIFTSVQDVFNVMVGYGEYLKAQGFVFTDYNSDLNESMDWVYSGKEFMFWSTQGWGPGSVITISPFADKLTFVSSNGVVDNVFDTKYEYGILKADGAPLIADKLTTHRLDNNFAISPFNTNDGIFFARLHVVQIEHDIILKNASYFNDIIYDIESGYRQKRIKIKGFRSSGWDGGLTSPGFIYDTGVVNDWAQYTDYQVGDAVKYSGNYYGALTNIAGTGTFNFSSWQVLPNQPKPKLLPNFDLKASQFQDFYSLDIDNYDVGAQKLAQHLIGYSPRVYLDNIFSDQTTQYKFYQGFIKDKGTKNSINKIDKASSISLGTSIDYNEEWAFRVGAYGAYSTEQNLEVSLDENAFVENPQIVNFVDSKPTQANDFLIYKTPSDLLITPANYASMPFATIDTSDLDVNFVLPTAGYVRLDDITATAYSQSSLVDIANNRALNDGDTIWIGYRPDGDWDVYRYTLLDATVASVALTIPGMTMTLKTDRPHGIKEGEIISIGQLGNEIPGVYIVKTVVDAFTFTLNTTLTAINTPFNPSVGLIFKFISSRVSDITQLVNAENINKLNIGEKVWIDNVTPEGLTSTWAVYEKVNAYAANNISNLEVGVHLPVNQQFGGKVVASQDGSVILVGSPNYKSANAGGGRVSVFKKLGTGTNQLTKLISIDLNSGNPVQHAGTGTTRFGQAIAIDSVNTCTIIGAPAINLVKFNRLNLQGINTFTNSSAITIGITTGTGNFGTDIYVTNTGTVYIGAPGGDKVGVITNYLNTTTVDHYITTSSSGSLFGTSISGSADGSVVAIGAPGANFVEIHNGSSVQRIKYSSTTSNFGQKVLMDPTGQTLFASAPIDKTVFVFTNINGTFVLQQELTMPNNLSNVQFGTDMSLGNGVLVIASTGTGFMSLLSGDGATFDSKTTNFYSSIALSGAAYSYNLIGGSWIYAQKVEPTTLDTNGAFGQSVAVANSTIFIGAPGQLTETTQTGQLHIFDQVGTTWTQLRVEEPVVDLSTINRAYTIDTKSESVLDYLEIIDPIKGRIPGDADQEIKYKTVFDPATYSLGITGTVNNSNANWLDEHVGELWWDLSAVKYINAEQGDLEFRRNNWNKTFPGCSIDIYEWVGSKYLPSQWSALADTNDGLAQGISGQPKFVDNSVISVKQIYDSVSNSFTNVYYYWVKNKTTIPTAKNRRMAAFDVANLIADPKAQGIKYASFISKDAVMLTNVKSTLNDSYVNLSIEMDNINNSIKKHTEWLLLQEGNPNSVIDITNPLTQKIKDSLLGQDSLGNPVPDPNLSAREAYGINFRPRQSMFVDRLAALQNVIQYINSVFAGLLINEENYNFERLYAVDTPDNPATGTYDLVVEDLTVRDSISTRNIRQASLEVNLVYGRIDTVNITDAGFGYGTLVGVDTDANGNYITWKGPSVTIVGDGADAEINTLVNSFGSIINVDIVNRGNGYTYLNATVRPYTVVVTLDSTVNNLWSLYQYENKVWTRIHTQSFNVSNYWKYVDWSAPTFTPQRTISKTIDSTYQLSIVDPLVKVGSYVRINNPGDNKYIIIEKTASNGTFSHNYNIVFKELGTIQFLESLWNNNVNNYGFDSSASWDQTPFSQSNVIETGYIMDALLIDILNGDLQIYNNTLFFTLVKYALKEQKFVDWAFKTSFIYVHHNAGELSQRPTYKLQDTSYFQQYIEETKPYHTKIRKFQSNYTSTELTTAYPTDFDLPSYYNTASNKFMNVTFGNPMLLQQPYVNWLNNYTYSVSDIVVYDGGSGYRSAPLVTIVPAPGDPGKGATAEAYMALGKVTSIKVTNPGSGYLTAPTIELSAGGNRNAVPARAFARISNNKVRNNKVHIKFDRVSGYNEVGSKETLDTFIGDASTNKFPLTWYPDTNLDTFTVKIDGILVLNSLYSLEFSENIERNGYIGSVATLVLNTIPAYQSVITVSYNKNIGLYNAVDRIRDYYAPVAGMPGNTATMLMSGLEYPGVTIDTLPFRTSAGWDTVGWEQSVWDDYDGDTAVYSTYGSTSTTTFTLPYIPSVGQRINVYVSTLDTATNAILSTVRIDGSTSTGAIINTFVGDGVTSVINIHTATSTHNIIDFRKEGSDGTVVPSDIDIDAIIDGGGKINNVLTASDGLADINIDGDGFVTPDNSYGPEENLPGQVSDTLAISVYSRPESSTPTVINRKYVVDGTQFTFDIGVTPANVDSVQVLLNNRRLYLNVDYTIDFVHGQITLISQPVVPIDPTQGAYYSTSTVAMRGLSTTPQMVTIVPGESAGAFNLPFNWNMYGQVYNQLYIGTGGYLLFGGAASFASPIKVGRLPFPAIYMEYTDLWNTVGTAASQLLDGNLMPGIWTGTGKVGNFNYWRVRYQTSHYVTKDVVPTMPAYIFEATLYTDGTDQYVEVSYGNIPSDIVTTTGDTGAVFGIAQGGSIGSPGAGVTVSPSAITNGSSHVYYSKASTGEWTYAGQGSVNPFAPLNQYSDIISGQKKVLSMSTIEVGGKNITESAVVDIIDTNVGNTFVFLSSYSEVQSEYVTVNGIPTTDYTTTSTNGSMTIVLNNALVIGDVLQVWFFNAPFKAFNEVHEQLFTSIPLSTTRLPLDQPPGTVPPYHNQVVVEYNGRRLISPEITYYIVEDPTTEYFTTYGVVYPADTISAYGFEVYVNGVLKSYGDDYGYDQLTGQIEFNGGVINTGDAMAIVVKNDSEYTIENDELVLSSTLPRTGVDNVRIVTYTNADGLAMRKDRFTGNTHGRYAMSRKVVSSSYVWVEVDGNSLISDMDFTVLSDKQTVQLSSKYKLTDSNTVIITSYESGQNSETIGFRVFYDNFGRSHYKRLSGSNSTQLVANLLSTDTVISVLDASKLSPPDLANRIPGVVVIDGERIEFYTMNGNVLGQLKRGALGTGIKDIYYAGTTVVDQGIAQTMRVIDKPTVEYHSTATTATNTVYPLSSFVFNTSTSVDVSTQVSVFLSGKKLFNTTATVLTHLDEVAFDSGITNSQGVSSDAVVPNEYTITKVGDTFYLQIVGVVYPGEQIKVVQNTTQAWWDLNSPLSLVDQNTEQVRFLRSSPAVLPDKYLYGNVTAVDAVQVLIEESGDTIDLESGEPLIGE